MERLEKQGWCYFSLQLYHALVHNLNEFFTLYGYVLYVAGLCHALVGDKSF